MEFGVAYEGSVEFANGIEENKLYRASDGSAIEVKLVKSHPCVDLGLTSGTLWAACNIGAVNDRPDQYGDYYRWGDKTCVTSTGIDLTINNCPWHTTGSNDKTGCTKYVPSDKASYAQDRNPDNKTVLDTEDDVVIDKWGNKWCLPIEAQLSELRNETEQVYGQTATLDNGETVTMSVKGVFYISKVYTDRYIFLPNGGCRYGKDISGKPSFAQYMSKSLDTSNPKNSMGLDISTDHTYVTGSNLMRFAGFTVRAVRAKKDVR